MQEIIQNVAKVATRLLPTITRATRLFSSISPIVSKPTKNPSLSHHSVGSLATAIRRLSIYQEKISNLPKEVSLSEIMTLTSNMYGELYKNNKDHLSIGICLAWTNKDNLDLKADAVYALFSYLGQPIELSLVTNIIKNTCSHMDDHEYKQFEAITAGTKKENSTTKVYELLLKNESVENIAKVLKDSKPQPDAIIEFCHIANRLSDIPKLSKIIVEANLPELEPKAKKSFEKLAQYSSVVIGYDRTQGHLTRTVGAASGLGK